MPLHPPKILPEDIYNRKLIDQVFPEGWKNPSPASMYNLVVIGAGSAGLVAAVGAASLGAKVALIEGNLCGGDCLNFGCVPSKSLLRSSRIAYEVANAQDFGIILPKNVTIDFPAVMERVRRLRTAISGHDAVKTLSEKGIDVFLGHGEFRSPSTIDVEGSLLHFSKAIIASGSSPFVPNIQGLASSGFYTNETIFSLVERKERMAVIGGGPLGCELAQAFQRLGTNTTLFSHSASLLPREDDDASAILLRQLTKDGVTVLCSTSISHIEHQGNEKVIHFESDGKSGSFVADAILLGTGRAPRVEGLGLENAGVDYDVKHGIHVNDYLQTTNSNIYAAGDCCLPYKFTHVADASARIALTNALFHGFAKQSSLIIPWCTYTDPEIAHVGLSEKEALKKNVSFDIFCKPFREVDRSITDSEEEGFVKILVRKGTDTIIGATIVGVGASNMISEICVAMTGGIGLRKIASIIHPYPTQAEAIKQIGDLYNRTRLSPFVKRVLRWWFALKR